MFTSRPHAAIIGGDKRPQPQVCRSAIEQHFPRIARELTQNWFRAGIDDFLGNLILDDRSSRHGFPLEVFDELLFLADIRWHLTHEAKPNDLALAADMEFLDYDPPAERILSWNPHTASAKTDFPATDVWGPFVN